MLRSVTTGSMVGLPPPPHARLSLFDSCHRKIRLIGGGPVAFLGGLVAKARRKEREGEPAGDPKLYLQEALLERKLPELDMRQLVDLPRGLDYNEWLASHSQFHHTTPTSVVNLLPPVRLINFNNAISSLHALALFDHVNLLYGTVSEFCTAASCPDMTGPGGRTYAWYDDRGKKSRVAAPQYVDYVMTFTQKTVNDETVFPTKYANEFPAQFEGVVRRVLRLLFHVVAHMYAAHFRQLALLRLHAHLHLTFAHLTALDARFALLDHKETEVLRDLEVALRLSEPAPGEADDASPRRRDPVVTQPLATA
ncbi:MOB kinase activator-like 2 isoform X2 [Helicoverpa zea]|uniref:MOB kinase activator-like 2 isoform X2 n=1 Tax=Helicoverpa zea TaxID=7113 RepID=UPI001F56B1CB|nr:MOB kinase activator-like 2 isoform X2 [Helicoverpa zea]